MEESLCVRKGAWSRVEDDLLRAYVQQYGEGKWHLVPTRAGLNRCRKSCRLRWLNYLKPNINRGEFSVDEIDMMQRLHKLLGNRWSLIAGRLPGRTANDVKNYWNTCARKKASPKVVVINNEKEEEESIKPHVVIKPRARTISRSSSPWLRESVLREGHHHESAKQCLDHACEASTRKCNNWWETMMIDDVGGNIDGWESHARQY